jgi:hypothetical protein
MAKMFRLRYSVCSLLIQHFILKVRARKDYCSVKVGAKVFASLLVFYQIYGEKIETVIRY